MRHVQRMFAEVGSSPAAELRLLRVELAQNMLQDPEYDLLSLAEVAEYSGFRSSAALRRAFVACGLPVPRRYCRSRGSVSQQAEIS